MGNTYTILKVATVAGTLYSISNAFMGSLALEDLLLALLVAITLVAAKNELHPANSVQGNITKNTMAVKRYVIG